MLLTNLQFIFQTHNIKQAALCFPGTKSFVYKLNFPENHKSLVYRLSFSNRNISGLIQPKCSTPSIDGCESFPGTIHL